MRLGISDEIIKNDDIRLTLSADGVSPNDNAQSVNLGGEMGFLKDKFQIRGGYKDLFLPNNEATFTFGVSLHEVNLVGDVLINLDYAYQNFVHLGNSNRFTVQITL